MIGRRGFTEESTTKRRVKGREYYAKNEKVGAGEREIRWTEDPTQGNIPSRHISPSFYCHTTSVIRCVGPKDEGGRGKCKKIRSVHKGR